MEIKNTAITQAFPKASTETNTTALSSISIGKTVKPEIVEKSEKITSADVEKALEKSNKILSQRSTGLEFSLDKESGKTIVKLIDKETEEILRQFPSEEMLKIAKELDRFQGSLVSEKV